MPRRSARRTPRRRAATSSGSELGRGTQRMEPRVPERLVGVDVPHARDDALVEQHRLERRSPPGEALGEKARREARAERLGAETRPEVLLELGRWEHVPGPEAAHVAVRDARAVVEVDRRRARARRASGKPPVMRRWTTSARPLSKRMTRYLPRRSTDATRSPVSSASTSAGSSGIVSRGSWTRTRESCRPSEARLEPRAIGLHLGQLRHPGGPGKNGG